MMYTAIFRNTANNSFSRSVVFNDTFDRQTVWEKALRMAKTNPFYEELFCLVLGGQEVWTPDVN